MARKIKFCLLRLRTKPWPLEIECSTTFDRAFRSKSLRSWNHEVYFTPLSLRLPLPLPSVFPFPFPLSLSLSLSWDSCAFAMSPVAWFRPLILGMSKQLCCTTWKSIFRSEFAVDCVSVILFMRAETDRHWPRFSHDLSCVGRPADIVGTSPIFFKCIDASV